MDWLAQNWVWLAFAAGLVLMMRRGGAGGCCGGHGSHGGHDKAAESAGAKQGGAGAANCCGGHGADDKHAESAQTKTAPAAQGHTH